MQDFYFCCFIEIVSPLSPIKYEKSWRLYPQRANFPQIVRRHLQYCAIIPAKSADSAMNYCDQGINEFHKRIIPLTVEELDLFRQRKLLVDPYKRADDIKWKFEESNDLEIEYKFVLYDRKQIELAILDDDEKFLGERVVQGIYLFSNFLKENDNSNFSSWPVDPMLLPLREARNLALEAKSVKINCTGLSLDMAAIKPPTEIPGDDGAFIARWGLVLQYACKENALKERLFGAKKYYQWTLDGIQDNQKSNYLPVGVSKEQRIEKRNRLFWEACQKGNKSYRDIGIRVAKEMGENDPYSESTVRRCAKEYHKKHHPDQVFKERKRGRKPGQ